MATATGNSDLSPKNLNLTPEEKRVFRQIFQQADTDSLGVVTGEVAVKFFERTNVPGPVLGEIWQIADSENRGLLTPSGFSIALRLIGHYQAGRDPTPELAYRAAPLPKFEGALAGSNVPAANAGPPPSPLQAQPSGGPIRVPALLPERVSEYSSLFAKSGAQNGILPGESAKQIFEKARLPNEVLGQIWNLADTEHRGALDITEFIIAMHLIASYRSGAMRALPQILPPGLYEAASRRGPPSGASAIPRQFTGPSIRQPQSPLSGPAHATPPLQSPRIPQNATVDWLISPQEKARFDSFYATLDTEGRGYVTGDQAVGFFSNSGLSEEVLAQIWDLADIRSEGQLNRDEFAVAMYLIWQQRSKGGPVPSALPPALMPPSMQNQTVPSPKPTAPTFDNTAFGPQQPKSAAEDLFGLDAFSTSAPTQIPERTGGSTSYANRAEFDANASKNPTPVTSTRGLPTTSRSPPTSFKPFVPTSSFGQTLTPQTTGISQAPSRAPQNVTELPADDLLGDNDPEISSRLTQETAELANMSNQIGTLRTQMQDVQGKKAARSEELSRTSAQKRELEQRLAQFRTQYEQEVREVNALDEQLLASRNSRQQLGQELAMVEGTLQDLQSKHREVQTALEADQRENAGLKERIRQINEEVNSLKPQFEKLKSDARQQKGMTAINRKQLATNEGEKSRLTQEIDDLTKDADMQAAQARAAEEKAAEVRAAAEARIAAAEARIHAAEARAAVAEARAAEATAAEESARTIRATSRDLGSSVTSPEASTVSHGTNPFFRKSPAPPEIAMSPGGYTRELPSSQQDEASFDNIFGPSFSSPTATGPPPTSFRSDPQHEVPSSVPSGQSVRSSEGLEMPTPSTSPPLSSPRESPHTAEPPSQAESGQVPSGALPIQDSTQRSDSVASSTKVSGTASRQEASETVMPTATASNWSPARENEPNVDRKEAIGPQHSGAGSNHDFRHISRPSTASSITNGDRPEAVSMRTTESEVMALEETIPGAFPGAVESSIHATPTGESTASSPVYEERGTARADPFAQGTKQQSSRAAAQDDFESTFAGFGESKPSGETGYNGGLPADDQARAAINARDEFPPIQNLGDDGDSDSDDDHGFADNFASFPQRNGQPGVNQFKGVGGQHELAANGSEHAMTPVPATASAASYAGDQLPPLSAQKSPPSYEQTVSSQTDHPRDANQFPPEFSGLLPSREVPMSSPPQALPDDPAQTGQTAATPLRSPPPTSSPASAFGHMPTVGQHGGAVGGDFPWLRNSSHPGPQPAQMSNRDDFDAAFDDLEEAQADKGDDDFTLVSSQHVDEFNPTFDTPASVTSFPLQSTQSPFAPRSTGPHVGQSFENFEHNGGSSKQLHGFQSPQPPPTATASHDWDAIFSGLDDSQYGQHNDGQRIAGKSPFDLRGEGSSISQPAPSAKPAAPPLGRALTSGTAHDDPILKRLTGMGYARADALAALEKFDYNIDKAADYLTSTH